MRIERIGPDQAGRLVPLNAVVQSLHAERRPDIFRAAPASASVARLFHDLLERDSHFALIAMSEAGADLGYVFCEVLDTAEDALTHRRLRGVLHHVAVLPEARRQGVAIEMIRAAKREFRSAGAREWTASYHVWNDASAALMRRAGLEPTIIRAEGAL